MMDRGRHRTSPPGAAGLRFLASAAVALVLALTAIPNGASALPRAARVDVTFDADCKDMVLAALQRARREVLLAIYSFSSREIAEALIDAKERGVEVRVKADAKQMDYDAAVVVFGMLESAKIDVAPIEMSSWYSMHHKFLVIDREVVLTGSYNFTVAASTVNYENLVLIVSTSVARDFIREFEDIESKQ